MKKSRFSESQVVAILKEGESGVLVARILREHGISHATFYRRKSRYGSARVSKDHVAYELNLDRKDAHALPEKVLGAVIVSESGQG